MRTDQEDLLFAEDEEFIVQEDIMDDSIQIGVVSSVEGFLALSDDWNEIAEASGATIFQTFEWNHVWWKHFGEGKQLYIVSFYQENMLIGIAPMFMDTVDFLGFSLLRSFRFIGSNISQPKERSLVGLISYTDYLDFIIAPGYEQVVYRLFVKHLLEDAPSVDELILDVVPETSLVWAKLIPFFKQQVFFIKTRTEIPSQLVHIDMSWDEYLSSLSKNRRYQTRLSLKRAQKKDYKVFDVKESDGEQELLTDFDRLVEMHQSKWNTLGSLGSFYEPQNYEFHKEIMLRLYQTGRATLLKAVPCERPDSCAAMDLLYQFNNRLFAIHGVADPESEFYSDGPGMVLLAVTLEQAAKSDVQTFDFLRGSDTYKLGYSNAQLNSMTVSISGIQNRFYRYRMYPVKGYIRFKRYFFREFFTMQMFFETNDGAEGIKAYWQHLKERFMKFIPQKREPIRS